MKKFRFYALMGILAATGALAFILSACMGPTIPEYRTTPLLVVLWDPQTRPLENRATPEQIDRLLFGAEAPSVRDYYFSQSSGYFTMTKAAILGWYKADKPADHYWKHPPKQTDCGFYDGHVEKWTEALRKADAEFDFSAYDTNHDGKLSKEELAILIMIPSQVPFGTTKFGKKTGLRAAQIPSNRPLVLDGVELGPLSEVYMGERPKAEFPDVAPINFGVVVHELGHLFHDFPDLYMKDPMRAGGYSIMDVSYTDAQVDPYLKALKGWVTLKLLNRPGTYVLPSVESSKMAYFIVRPPRSGQPTEVIIIENRERGTYDNRIPDPGIVVWRVVDFHDKNDWGRKNLRMLRRSAIEPGTKNESWHGEGAGKLSLDWSDGSPSGLALTAFSNSGREMTFDLVLENLRDTYPGKAVAPESPTDERPVDEMAATPAAVLSALRAKGPVDNDKDEDFECQLPPPSP